MAKFQIFQDSKGEYRWRLRADNHEVVADSAEGYTRKESCQNGIEVVKRIAPEAEVEDET